MPINIIEFKARVNDPDKTELLLQSLNPSFTGEDRQADTYFKVSQGRLKLREGNIENALIWYNRPNAKGSKQSEVLLYQHNPEKNLKEILTKVLGVKVVVDKTRRIYFIDNVKFHFDEVQGLGKFIEVEAIDETGELGLEKIQQQCDHYASLFGIQPQDFVAVSYSDLLMQQQQQTLAFPTLKTERLLLRQIVPEDIYNVHRGLAHPEVIKHFGISFPTLEATREQMDWYANMIANDTGRCWAICSADNSTFYGVCTLNFWNKTHRKAETGYWLLPEFWKQGITTEAMHAVLEYGFNSMKLNRITAGAEDDNEASIALLLKAGFAYEGTLKCCEIKNDRCINLCMYAKLNPALSMRS